MIESASRPSGLAPPAESRMLVAVLIKTVRTVSGFQILCACLISATDPATCGVAIDVPSIRM